MNKEQEGIIELVGQEYTKWFYDNAVPSVSGKPILNGEWILTRGEFINKCKNDSEFYEKWGLKIEEKELSLEERLLLADKICKEIRQDLYTYSFNNPIYTGGIDQRPDDVERHHLLNDLNIPTKLITITYNDKRIESYE